MSDNLKILGDARWIPHGFDAGSNSDSGMITFIRIDRDRLAEPAFLADADASSGTQPVAIPIEQIAAANIPQVPLNYIFHTAFCRSTLLTRALENPGLSAGLSEPGIFAKIGNANPEVISQVSRLVARPWDVCEKGDDKVVFVKPTNHANALIPALMQAKPDARAILMTNPLPSFLTAVLRKGMMGRRWARMLYLEVMGYAGMDLGMQAKEQFAMTDLQAAGLAWFLNQRYFDALQRKYGDRVRVLDGDVFGADPAKILECIGKFANVPIDATRAMDIASGPVFTMDAKTGEDFAVKSTRDAAATQSAVVEDEIAKIGEWIGMIADQAGLTIPVPHNLS